MTNITNPKLDLTGLNVDNLIVNEVKSNIDSFSRIVIPIFGDYYTDSLVVKENTTTLVRGTDYECLEYNQTYSLKSGKEICSSIVLLRNIAEVTIDYQALGGEDAVNSNEIVAAFDLLDTSNPAITWQDIENKPKKFKSLPHQHDIAEVYGFEYLVNELVRVKTAMENGPMPSFNALVTHIDSVLAQYDIDQSVYLTENMAKYMTEFSDTLTTSYFGIDYLKDFTISYERDGGNIGVESFSAVNLTLDKYLSIEALVGLKNVLYASFLTKGKTGLNLNEAQYGLPVLQTLIQMTNGSTFSFISQEKARTDSVVISEDIYSANVKDPDEIVITKLNNNKTNKGGIYLGYLPNNLSIEIGSLLSTTPNDKLTWKRILGSDEVLKILSVIDNHCSDFGNPHQDQLYLQSMALDKVENLPVVSREDILGIKSVHKYLTFDSLLYFMRAFLLQNGKSFAPKEPTKNQFIIDNCVVVYTPAGIICKPQCEVTEPFVTEPPFILAKINQACGVGSKSFIVDTGYFEETITDKSLIGQYEIGTSSYLFQNIAHFSRCCGYDEDLMSLFIQAPFAYEEIAELEIGELYSGSYFTITVTITNSNNQQISSIRIGSAYIGYQNRFYFKTGNSNNSQVKLEYSNRYYANKVASVQTFNIVDPGNSMGTDEDDYFAYLYVDRAYIKQGTVAYGELYVDRPRISTESSDTFNLTWNIAALQNSAIIPKQITFSLGQQIAKLEFEIPYSEQFNSENLYVSVDLGNSPVVTNEVKITAVPSTKITRTVPLYVNNVQTGTLTISRENETGFVTIENITIPSAQNTSHVYFFRGTNESNYAPVIGVVDVWNTGDEFDWEFPLPVDGNVVTPAPTPTVTTSVTPSPSTTITPSTTMPGTTVPPTTTTPQTTNPGGSTTSTPTQPTTTLTLPPVTQSQFIIRALADKQDAYGDTADFTGEFGSPVYSNKYWDSEQQFVNFITEKYPAANPYPRDQEWPGSLPQLRYVTVLAGPDFHFKIFPRSSVPANPVVDPGNGLINLNLYEEAPLFADSHSWMNKEMILDMTSLTPGETYILECWTQENPTSSFVKDQIVSKTTHHMRISSSKASSYGQGMKKVLVAGRSNIKHRFRVGIMFRDETPFSYYFKVYNINSPSVVNTSNTVTLAFVQPPVIIPPLELSMGARSSGNNNSSITANDTISIFLDIRKQQNVRYTVDYYVRAVYGTALDTGYVKRLDVSLAFDVKSKTNENEPRSGSYTPVYSPGYIYDAYKLPETYWSDVIDNGNGTSQFQISTYIQTELQFKPNGAITDAAGLTMYVYAEVYPVNDPSNKVSNINNPVVFNYINN